MDIKLKLLGVDMEFDVTVKRSSYNEGGGIALWGEHDGEPFATFTSNLPDMPIAEGFAAIKTYSENEGLMEQLIAQRVIEKPSGQLNNGFATFPICRVLLKEEVPVG